MWLDDPLDDPLVEERNTTRRITPITPNMIPAVAIPEPFSPRSFIWLLAIKPKIIARIDPAPKIQTTPKTNDATANPLVLFDVGCIDIDGIISF